MNKAINFQAKLNGGEIIPATKEGEQTNEIGIC